MSERGVRRFIADLLRGRRPRRFAATDDEADQLRAAITLRGARPGDGAPSEEFVADLHRRLADQLTPAASRPTGVSRRYLVATAGVAAGAAAVGAGVDHLLAGQATPPSPGEQTLRPNTGQWRTVVASADLPEGGVTGFDLGSVIGFVARVGGQLVSVSGVCTHLGCRLALNPAARRLDCPCHLTSFALGGQLLRHQLPVPPAALPRLQVRETSGVVQVYAPPA